MNTTTRSIFTAATITAAAAGIGLTTAAASAQDAPYDRVLRPQDITFTPSSIPGATDVDVHPVFLNHTTTTFNLSGIMLVEVRRPHHDPVYLSPVQVPANMLGQGGYPCEDSSGPNCLGHCNIDAGCGQNPNNISNCCCRLRYELVRYVFPNLVLSAGDMVTASIFPAANSMPELDTSNDSATVIFQPTACPADLNGDGGIDVRDYLAFLSLYAAADPRADFNASGHIDVADYLAFLAAYATGCN